MSYEKSALKLEECQFGLNESLHSSSPYKNRYIPPPPEPEKKLTFVLKSKMGTTN